MSGENIQGNVQYLNLESTRTEVTHMNHIENLVDVFFKRSLRKDKVVLWRKINVLSIII